jgi:hypothetical protein
LRQRHNGRGRTRQTKIQRGMRTQRRRIELRGTTGECTYFPLPDAEGRFPNFVFLKAGGNLQFVVFGFLPH